MDDVNELNLRQEILKYFPHFKVIDLYWVGNRRRLRVASSIDVKYWDERIMAWVKHHLAQPRAQRRYDTDFSLLILLDNPE